MPQRMAGRAAARPAARGFLAGAFLAATLAAGGCSINPQLRVAEALPAGTGALLLGDVPFHPQTEYQCGPAALAGVLGASGVAITPEALVPQVYLPEREGSLQLELVAATRRAGRIPYVVDPSPGALLAEVADGRPVLVLQNLLTRSVPRWHYAVLVGADPAGNRLVLNSGTTRGLALGARKFLRTWDWAGRWGMVALRPGQLPARAEPAVYLTAVADFEAVAGGDAARPAYEAALVHWPQDSRPRLALGNHAYAAGDAAGAVAHYRAGLELSPGDPVLANNYASALGELGCRDEARAVLASAIAAAPADDRWRPRLSATVEEIEQGTAERSASCEALH